MTDTAKTSVSKSDQQQIYRMFMSFKRKSATRWETLLGASLPPAGHRCMCRYVNGFVRPTGHFSKAEKVKEKEREKDAKRHEERERSDGHSSSEKDRRKEEKKRKHGDLSQDKHIPNKR